MSFSDQLVAFVKAWEGLKLKASRDTLASGEISDIGYGHVLRAGEHTGPITEPEAERILKQDLLGAYQGVMSVLPDTPLDQPQADALTSLVFNCGLTKIAASTMFRFLRDKNYAAAADEFPKWCRAGGRVVEGLRKRRIAEQRMFLVGDYSGRP